VKGKGYHEGGEYKGWRESAGMVKVAQLRTSGNEGEFALHRGRKNHKAILDVHAPFGGFAGCRDIKVSYKCGNGNLQHHMRQIQAPTDPSASSERHHVRGHTAKII